MKYNATAKPLLYDSQLKARLGLVRKRLQAYPMADMNFTMMDLERPTLRKRHADFCTYDLTGRMMLFYSLADGIDGTHCDDLQEIFKRVMHSRRKSGLFDDNPDDQPVIVGAHFISGLVNYYTLSGDMRALNAAEDAAERMLRDGDRFFKCLESNGTNNMNAWISEGFAELYRETRDEKYLDAIRRIAKECMGTINYAHSHGYMTTLRGIMRAAIYSNDDELAMIVKERLCEIMEIGVTEIGDISEAFPRSHRNEGCSIADFIMLCMLCGHYFDDPSCYEAAEYSLWNALYFNQFVTGGFGHRFFAYRGYRTYVEEAWWCCTQNAGTCFAEIARHVATVRGGKVKVNFLIPGEYTLPGENGNITVTITTKLPTKAATVIKVVGTKNDVDIRIPDYIKEVSVRRVETDFGYTLYLDGKLGHYAEKRGDGYVMKYGPLVLAPMIYTWDMCVNDAEKTSIPEGYTHENMPGYGCMLDIGEADENGFYHFEHDPIPAWIVFEEGEMADIAGGEAAAAHIPVCFDDGEKNVLYFQPLCSATTNLTLMDIPVVFDLKK